MQANLKWNDGNTKTVRGTYLYFPYFAFFESQSTSSLVPLRVKRSLALWYPRMTLAVSAASEKGLLVMRATSNKTDLAINKIPHRIMSIAGTFMAAFVMP